ncbi:MAG: MFS transporter, partial [Chloroflexi bacterium]
MSPSKSRLRNLTILVGSTAMMLATAGLAPALPGMAAAFQDVPNAALLVRVLLTLPALSGAAAAPFAGLLMDWWGRKPVIVVSLLLFGLAGSAGFVLDSLAGILISRLLLGLAAAGLASGFLTLVTDYFTGARLNQFLGYLGAFAGFAGVVFQFLSGALADIGWRFPFLLHLVAFVILLGVLLAIDEPRRRAQAQPQSTAPERIAFPFTAIGLIYAVALLGIGAVFVLIVYLPFYLTSQAGVSNSQVGGFIALQYQRLRTRLSVQAIAAVTFLALGSSLLVAALTSSYALVVAGLLLGGIGLGLLPPNLIAWLAVVAPPASRGRAVGG